MLPMLHNGPALPTWKSCVPKCRTCSSSVLRMHMLPQPGLCSLATHAKGTGCRVHAWMSGQLQVQPCSARCITERLQAASTLDQPALHPPYLTADSGSNCPSIAALRESLVARPQIICLLCRVGDVQTALTRACQSAPSEDGMPEAAPAPGKLHQDLQDATHQVRACLGYGACVDVHRSKREGAENDRCCTADCRAEAAAGCPANSGQAGQQRPRSHAAERVCEPS